MQSIRRCLRLLSNTKCFIHDASSYKTIQIPNFCSSIHTSSVFNTDLDSDDKKKTHWLSYNDKFFPVQTLEEERRPAYVCHAKYNLKYSPKKMWYIAGFVRGMTVDEAVKQLSFMKKKGACMVKDTILEAQKLAVEEHNVEYKSNLWVAESFCGKGYVIKGIRRHARSRPGRVRYQYCHYFVRLEEGKPPKHYKLPAPKDGEELLNDWMQKMRMRKIPNSL